MRNNSKAKVAAGFLVAILCLFALMNKNSLYKGAAETTSRFRFPASAMFGEMRSASIAVEKKLAAELAPTEKKRELASIGHPANALENLRFGILEGKYALTMDGEDIRDINFIDTPDSDGSPKDIGNRAEFLKQNSALFGFKGIPQQVSVDVKGNRVVEIYQAASPAPGTKTMIQISLDDSDRLISVHAEKISDLKIF